MRQDPEQLILVLRKSTKLFDELSTNVLFIQRDAFSVMKTDKKTSKDRLK